MNPTHEDDAQRAMEQRALRNVRGLVDNLERADQHERRVQKRLLTWIVVAVVLVVAGFATYFALRKDAHSVVVRPPAAQPAQR